MIEKAVIDQIVEGKKAVLLIGDKEELWTVDLGQLPEGVKEGTWLSVEIVEDVISILNVDHEESERAKKRVTEKLEELRLRQSSTYKK